VAEQPPERRILRVDARPWQESQVTIEIKDQGSGFPAGDRERIFAPFHSGRPGGSGLGLAIARRLLTQMGGTISAQGEVGKGATFTLILDSRPRARA
jgi:two-component system sensor kinase FixL